MTRTQSGLLTIFHLDDMEFEDAEIKNRCLIQAESPFIAYVLNAEVSDRELLTVLEEEQKGSWLHGEKQHPIVYISGNASVGKADYIQTLELASDFIVALLFHESQIQRCGAFNSKLSAKTNFEFLCRMARETGNCVVRKAVCAADRPEKKSNEIAAEETAETLAYMIRNHMNNLHVLGKTDKVFSLFCECMRIENIFPVFQQKVNLFLSDERAYEKLAGQTAPFVILRGDNTCGGILQSFADDLADGLVSNGQAVILIDDNMEQYDELQNMVCKGVVGFQNKALEIDFFQKIHGPKFQFWFDNPLRFENVLRNLPEEYYILCQDANYASLIRDYYHTGNAIQFPPGGKLLQGAPCDQKERPYDIVFVGTYFEDSGNDLEGFQREFYDHMLCHPSETFEEGLSYLLRKKAAEGQGIQEKDGKSDEERFIELSCFLKPACRAVIGYYRNAVISTILKAGFELHVYGDSWNDYEGDGREYLKIHPYVTVEESLKELGKSKIGLNIMSWHKAGMTERVANIMLSGAVCLTEETVYLRENMQVGEEIVTFGLDRLEELPVKIKTLLEAPDLRERIAGNAYRDAVARYTWLRRAEELIMLSEHGAKDALTVFVATHVKCDPPHDPIYVPLHVGRHGKTDLGYLGDDTGENISDLNFLYGELTGLFWIWQNVNDLDYVGLCHYRRYFLNSRGQAMDKSDYVGLLAEYDAIVPRHAVCEGSYYQHFGRSHNSRDLDAVGRALKRLYPSYAAVYDQAMEGNIFYGSNLMVTRSSILKAYAEWLFQIFVEASDDIDVSDYDNYHRRVYGFLSEQMFYVFALANGLKCCEMVVGISEEKAETRALKESLKQLIEQDKIDEARKLFDAQLEVRPDLLLPGSDVNGELQDIYRQLMGDRL